MSARRAEGHREQTKRAIQGSQSAAVRCFHRYARRRPIRSPTPRARRAL